MEESPQIISFIGHDYVADENTTVYLSDVKSVQRTWKRWPAYLATAISISIFPLLAMILLVLVLYMAGEISVSLLSRVITGFPTSWQGLMVIGIPLMLGLWFFWSFSGCQGIILRVGTDQGTVTLKYPPTASKYWNPGLTVERKIREAIAERENKSS